jgi:3-deoxy-manno-octulosonate cytidylyltransferase (CMP-KDO synthetase)
MGSPPRDRIRAVAIIPARLGSVRLPRKMLLAKTGRALFEHTARNVLASEVFERVVVATDSLEILDAAERAGLDAVMTRSDHPSGTDRVHEAAGAVAGGPFDVIVNVQGDEPELERADLALLVGAFADPAVEIATLCGAALDLDDAREPTVVKVVRDAKGDALYFSRALIPARSHAPAAPETQAIMRHIGIYGFRPAALARFCSLPRGPLERVESLEQLRWLESGGRIRCLEASRVPLGIDTERDYDGFVERQRRRERAS